MSIKRLFYMDFNETRTMLRRQVEDEIEATLEEERRDGFAAGAITFGEDISLMTNEQKENLRVKSVKELELTRMTIDMLLNQFVDNMAVFMVTYDSVERIAVVAAIIAAICRYFDAAIVLALFAFGMFLVSRFNALYAGISYAVSGCDRLLTQLLDKYNEYGRTEAAISFADYRGISTRGERKWIFTTSHIVEDSNDDGKDP